MQLVSSRDNLHKYSKLVSWENSKKKQNKKNKHQFFVNWIAHVNVKEGKTFYI